jgi:aspartate aminotransferase
MESLRAEYAIYGLNNGRINLASIANNQIDYIVKSVLTVTGIENITS